MKRQVLSENHEIVKYYQQNDKSHQDDEKFYLADKITGKKLYSKYKPVICLCDIQAFDEDNDNEEIVIQEKLYKLVDEEDKITYFDEKLRWISNKIIINDNAVKDNRTFDEKVSDYLEEGNLSKKEICYFINNFILNNDNKLPEELEEEFQAKILEKEHKRTKLNTTLQKSQIELFSLGKTA